MMRLFIVILILLFVLGCGSGTITPTVVPPTTVPITPIPPTITPITPTFIVSNIYHVSTNGDDANPGTLAQPWQTIQKAVDTLTAGDMVYVHGGQYDGIKNGWHFQNSGTQSRPITLANYPGEQVVFKINTDTYNDREIFTCNINPTQPPAWNTPKADYIRIIGTDVLPQTLSNNAESKKGIVIQGVEGEQSAGITASDCDYWEIAGVDFVEVSAGIFTFKNNWQMAEEHSTDYWRVHDNRVYIYYRESGMQFNGNFNVIENNEIYKISDRLDSPYGCQMLNLLGNNSIVRGNTLSRMGSASNCLGILLEWDLSDANLIEQNKITDVPVGIAFQGGDNNIVRNNEIIAAPDTKGSGVAIASYDNQTTWPCDDYAGNDTSVGAILPPNDPLHPDYPYYFNPRNCHSMSNQIIGNIIIGFKNPWVMYPISENSNIFRDNITSQP